MLTEMMFMSFTHECFFYPSADRPAMLRFGYFGLEKHLNQCSVIFPSTRFKMMKCYLYFSLWSFFSFGHQLLFFSNFFVHLLHLCLSFQQRNRHQRGCWNHSKRKDKKKKNKNDCRRCAIKFVLCVLYSSHLLSVPDFGHSLTKSSLSDSLIETVQCSSLSLDNAQMKDQAKNKTTKRW